MDRRVVAWAHAAKGRRPASLPTIWLFTDAARLADPLPAIARLPPGLAGVVFRHDGVPGRSSLGLAVAALCRVRRLALAVAGDWRLAAALHAGLHLREGQAPPLAPPRLARLTSSAHTPAGVRRARRAGARLIFISPLFATASHPAARPLGQVKWSLLARGAGERAAALGGIRADTVRFVPRHCRAIGLVGAALPGPPASAERPALRPGHSVS